MPDDRYRTLHMIASGTARWETESGSQPFGGPSESKFFYEGKSDLFSMSQFLRGTAARTPGHVLKAVSAKVQVCACVCMRESLCVYVCMYVLLQRR